MGGLPALVGLQILIRKAGRVAHATLVGLLHGTVWNG
jgi:hypothetical protein